jgi:hypothetical protein
VVRPVSSLGPTPLLLISNRGEGVRRKPFVLCVLSISEVMCTLAYVGQERRLDRIMDACQFGQV